jgi:hypothetical protein
LPLPHTATHPRKPTVLVRDLSTREVAVKWIAHFPCKKASPPRRGGAAGKLRPERYVCAFWTGLRHSAETRPVAYASPPRLPLRRG